MAYTLNFDEINMTCIKDVGGKNASLGEMYQNLTHQGVRVPDGFAVTASAYWQLLEHNNLKRTIKEQLAKLDQTHYTNLEEVGANIRNAFLQVEVPKAVLEAIRQAYQHLETKYGTNLQLAVRSSATAEDLPTASFAGQLESYLNIEGEEQLLEICLRCYASLFTNRAIKYRDDCGFDHLEIALSIGVQLMVRADQGAAGVGFTLDTETGFRNVILLNGAWGLGENVVQGNVNPDEFVIFKPSLKKHQKAILNRRLGAKQLTMVYSQDQGKQGATTQNIDTPTEQRDQFVLEDQESEQLGKWGMLIEEHYQQPMDFEWAKDGITGNLFIVQARPETVQAANQEPYKLNRYHLKEKSEVLTSGIALGDNMAKGKARILESPADAHKLQEGEVLVTEITNPDWDPIMKKASAIITNKGGRTSHAAIVAREMETVAIVGSGNATQNIQDGQQVTVSCAEGKTGRVYDKLLDWEVEAIDTRQITKPETEVMIILGDPEQAFQLSFMPNDGIGLMRLEFVINNVIQIHPMALVYFDQLQDQEAKSKIESLTRHYDDKERYFVDQLSQAVGTIAAAFHPKDVIVRMSDFKSNEYANLIGGNAFEPKEENPMLGFRGAARYYNDRYRQGFRLECEAMKVVRDEMGLTNVKLMIPFCRTVEEGRQVVNVMNDYGLKQGENGLAIYVMTEIPSNVVLAKEFAKVFDGFSIGSNDLTQLTMGLDRDSELVSDLFSENNTAIQQLIANVIQSAKETGTKIGLCGQAPSDLPEFAGFLVEQGINSISFNPDALIKGIKNINNAEKHLNA